MNTLLLFFALPVATIIFAIVVEKILRNPFLTAGTFFAIFLIVAFAAFDSTFLIFVIGYTILAFITAVIVEIILECKRRRDSCRCNLFNITENETITLSDSDIERIANQLAEIQNNSNQNDNNCNCLRNTVTADITNNTTGRRTSWCCYRRN